MTPFATAAVAQDPPAPADLSSLMTTIATAVLEHADVLAWVQDESENFLWVNAKAAEFFGRSASALVGMSCGQVFVRVRPDVTSDAVVTPPHHPSYRRVLLDGRPMRVREVLAGADGVHHLEGYVFPVAGRALPRAVGVVLSDTTVLVGAQQRSSESVKLYLDVLAHAAVPLAVLDRDGAVVECNSQLRALTELRSDQLVGRPFWSLVAKPRAATLRQAFAAFGEGVNRLSSEELLERPGRPDVRCRVTVSRLPDRNRGGATSLLTITGARVEREDIGTQLRPIEREVLCQVAAGATTAKIASVTHLSRQGVDYNLRTLMTRFGAGNRSELVAKAYTMGVLSATCWPPRLTSDPRPGSGDPGQRHAVGDDHPMSTRIAR